MRHLLIAGLVVVLTFGVARASFAGDDDSNINGVSADQAATQPQFSRREPVVALVLSWVLPGLGQIYNGPTETKKGLIMMGADVAFWTLAFVGASNSNQISCTRLYCTETGTSALVPIGVLGAVADSVYSMVDGYTHAGQLNRSHGLAFRVSPETVAGRVGVRAEASFSVPLK